MALVTISLRRIIMHKKDTDFFTILILCSAMLIWASSFIGLKIAIEEIPAMSVIFGRMVIASLCFVFFIKKFTKIQFSKKDIKYISIMVLCEPCLYFIFESYALQNTTAGQAGMITSMMPLLTAIGAGILLKEIISRQLIAGSLLAVCGAVWMSLDAVSSQNAPNPLLGNFLEFLAMVCGAGYTIAIRHLSANFSALFLTAIQSFVGAIFFLPFAIYEYANIPFEITATALGATLYLGIVVTLGGYGLFNYALSRTHASTAAAYVNLIPVFAVILAYFILNEKLSVTQVYASLIILFGVFITQLPDGLKSKLVQSAYAVNFLRRRKDKQIKK